MPRRQNVLFGSWWGFEWVVERPLCWCAGPCGLTDPPGTFFLGPFEESPWWSYLRTLPAAAHAASPSLWEGLVPGQWASTALQLLRTTSIGPLLASDAEDLAALRTAFTAPDAALQLGQKEPQEGFATLRQAIGLVSTRAISGVGLVPLLDLLNGAPTGEHNATIERTNIAANRAAEQVPCVAAVSSKQIEKGEEIVLAYGEYSAAEFLYRYGWIPGGPDLTSGAAGSPHEVVNLRLSHVWSVLTEKQRAVLQRYKFSAEGMAQADVDSTGNPFGVPAKDAPSGPIPPLLRQLALVACCTDEDVLAEMARTGKVGDSHSVSPADIASMVLTWSGDQVCQLAAVEVLKALTPEALQSFEVRMALRLTRGERERLLRWMSGLQRSAPSKAAYLKATTEHVAAMKALG